MKDFFSKFWNVVVSMCSYIKSAVTTFIEAFSENAETYTGKYNMIIAVQMLIMFLICIVTFMYGFTSAIYGAAVVLLFGISTRHIYYDAISDFYNETLDKKEEADEVAGVEDSDLAEYYNTDEDEIEDFSIKNFLPTNQKEVTHIGMLYILLCVAFNMTFNRDDIPFKVGFFMVLCCLIIVLLAMLLERYTKKFSESDEFKMLMTSVSEKTSYVAAEAANIKEGNS